MDRQNGTPNRLIDATSPYLLQHAYNPVDWYPWGEEAFAKARAEDKPVFLSIGYSACHWCHVMARESFESDRIADILNRYFVSVKVDREERPDIDSVYMTVCQAFTGGGGWPASIFMTAEQAPFFAGTYFPPTSRHGALGFEELLLAIWEQWRTDRSRLLQSAQSVVAALGSAAGRPLDADTDDDPIAAALEQFRSSYDSRYGGFGRAPKFPSAHNLIFLMTCYQKRGDADALHMAKHTLTQMRRGGLFDQIGFGFCRYSTDRRFLAPHFEKMLYDNALLLQAYCMAYEVTQDPFYLQTADKTAQYVLGEMTAPDGAFYSAQDADSDGEEGKYYLFVPEEILRVLGEKDGPAFCRQYDITPQGNFEGKSIPNLLNTPSPEEQWARLLPKVYAYRRGRYPLRTDDKVLTAWNSLMIAALCSLYRISRNGEYLRAAARARDRIEAELCDGDTLYVGLRDGRRAGRGYIDDYAAYIHALLALYGATLDAGLLSRAEALTKKAVGEFFDTQNGGFYLYGGAHESLILRPKETYDGAMPSGNSLMAYDLVRLCLLAGETRLDDTLQKQLRFMRGEAARHPAGYAMFLTALSDWLDPPQTVTVAPAGADGLADLPFAVSLGSVVRVLPAPTRDFPLKDGKTTYYVCDRAGCHPPANDLRTLRQEPAPVRQDG